jgi:hypothetical protein
MLDRVGPVQSREARSADRAIGESINVLVRTKVANSAYIP